MLSYKSKTNLQIFCNGGMGKLVDKGRIKKDLLVTFTLGEKKKKKKKSFRSCLLCSPINIGFILHHAISN